MATVTMTAPMSSGTVQSPYGNYPIVNSKVTVDARLIQPLTDAGFMIDNPGYVTMDVIVAMLSQKADATALASKADVSQVPVIATAMPLPETTAPSAGVDGLNVPGAKHTHPRLTSAQYGTSNASGVIGPITFTRSFALMPCPVLSAIGQPGINCNVSSWVQDGNGNYVGATIFVSKRTASSSTTSSVITISVITSVNTTTSDTPVSGQLVSIVMLAQS